MRHRFITMLAVIAVSLTTGALNVYADTHMSEAERRAIDLINEERETAGVCPICGEKHLCCDSCVRSEEVTIQFSHTRPDGTPYYTVDPDHIYGEILLEGCSTPEEAVDLWMDSANHRERILDPMYKSAGVDSISKGGKTYWVVEFGT